jgi:hypothetical protein
MAWRALGFFILFILALERPAYGQRGRAGSRLGDPLADDVIATIVLVRPGAFRAGHGATLTFCEGGHQCAAGMQPLVRNTRVPRSC